MGGKIMSNEIAFVKYAKPYCREHNVECDVYNEVEAIFSCPICKVAVSKYDVLNNCHAPHYWKQTNPFILFN